MRKALADLFRSKKALTALAGHYSRTCRETRLGYLTR